MVDELELHPWNHEFEWTDRSGPFRRLSDEQVASFDRDGFVVLPDVFDDDALAPLIEVIDRNEAATDEFLRGLDDGRITIAETGAITFTVHLAEREPITGPNVTDAVRKAYIPQYAPEGAAVLGGDPAAGAPTSRVVADANTRQFPVLIHGDPAPTSDPP